MWETVLWRVLLFRSEVREGLVLAAASAAGRSLINARTKSGWSRRNSGEDWKRSGRTGSAEDPTLLEKHFFSPDDKNKKTRLVYNRLKRKKCLFTFCFVVSSQKNYWHLWNKVESIHRCLQKRKIWTTNTKISLTLIAWKVTGTF